MNPLAVNAPILALLGRASAVPSFDDITAETVTLRRARESARSFGKEMRERTATREAREQYVLPVPSGETGPFAVKTW